MTVKHLRDTKFWHELMHGVYGPRKGGARIIIDAEDAETGAGKTGLAVSLGLACAKAFGYEMTKDDLTLSGAEYLRRWREHPNEEQPSVIILDELSGAGAGDSRRSMSNQNVNLGRSWQLMRKKRVVTITTLPHWSDADKKMRRFADFRLWCRKKPIGYFTPYAVGATFDDGKVRTSRIGDTARIRFPNLDKHNDPLYRDLAKKKDELLDSEHFDADELVDGPESEEQIDPDEAQRQQKIGDAQRMRDDGLSTRKIADYVDMSHTWVVENTTSATPDQGVQQNGGTA